jgi:uncharacterized protein (TIGR03435 family)
MIRGTFGISLRNSCRSGLRADGVASVIAGNFYVHGTPTLDFNRLVNVVDNKGVGIVPRASPGPGVALVMNRLSVPFWIGALILETAAECPAQPRAAGPSFEVASIKVSAPSTIFNGREKGGPGTESPGQWTCTGLPLSYLLFKAWNLDGPARLSKSSAVDDAPRYDIAAKVPPGTNPGDFRLMIQRLLIERLALEVHIESKELNVQELTVAKNGPKMKPAETAPPGVPAPAYRGVSTDSNGNLQLPAGYSMAVVAPTREGGFVILGRMQGIDGLINQLKAPIGQIIDKTGLAGKYDFALKCSGDDLTSAAAPGASGPDGANPQRDPNARFACVKSALAEQLGLKLQPAKAMVDVLIVDHFNKVPSEN